MGTIWLAPLQFGEIREDCPKGYVPPRDHKETRHTLVLDIDETLVHSMAFSDRTYVTALRPYVIPFLREMHELFEVIYWTAGTEFYGKAVLKAIEAAGQKFDGESVCGENPVALYRQHTAEEWDYMKYIPLLKRPVQNVLMIDDRTRSFRLTPRQAILIEGWSVDPRALLVLPEPELREFLDRKEPVDSQHLPTAPKFSNEAVQDREFEDMRQMLIRCAKSENPSLEMDHYRPDDYNRSDNFLGQYNGLGNWLPQRRDNLIAPMSRKVYLEAFSKLKPELQKYLGDPEAIVGHK